MKVEDAATYFGSQRKLAESLDINEALVSRWKNSDGLVPMKYIMRLKEMSSGELDLVMADYR